MKFTPHLILAGLLCICTSGCSQPVTFSPETGFCMNYPKKGQDVSSVIEAMFDRMCDPHVTDTGLTGQIKATVTMKVITADEIVPRPDLYLDTFIVHGKMKLTLPSGQVTEFDDEEEVAGTWKDGRFQRMYLAWCGTPYYHVPHSDSGSIDPSVVGFVQSMFGPQPDEWGLDNYSCVLPLIEGLEGKDLSAPIDLQFWLKAHEIARAHSGIYPVAPSDTTPSGSTSAPPQPKPAAQPSTVAAPAPSVEPVSPEPVVAPPNPSTFSRQVVGHVTFPISDQFVFTIQITDPAWLRTKNALPAFSFNRQVWNQITAGKSRIEAEQILHDQLATSFEKTFAKLKLYDKPKIDEVAIASYTAQQPDATPAQKQAYAEIAKKDDPELQKSSNYIVAMRILIKSIADDINQNSGQ